jgi:glycosyltransferase involved in cell wall biosynthesis
VADLRVLVLSSANHPEVLAEAEALGQVFSVDYEYIDYFPRSQLKQCLIATTRNLWRSLPALIRLRIPPFPPKDFFRNFLSASLLIENVDPKKRAYDVIYSNWLFPSGFAGLLLSRIIQCKLICVPRGYDIQGFPGSTTYGINGYLRIISKYVMLKADAIVVTHQVHRRTAIRLCGDSIDKKIIYIRSALPDLTKLLAGVSELPPSILTGKIARSRKIVLYAPSFRPIYGILDLMRAIPLVIRRAPEAFFILAGQGQLEKRVRGIIQEEGLTDNVLMLGQVKYATMLALYQRAEVVCDLAYFGSGTTTIEAFCFAKPVIAFASQKRYVDDGRNGFEVKPGDYSDLATKLIGLLNDNELRSQMSINARQSFETNFLLEGRISKIRQLIVSLTQHKDANRLNSEP